MPHLYDWLYGRLLELDMTGHAPPWPLTVFNPETKAFEAVSLERSDGEMRWQAQFRPDGTYYVGDVVKSGAGLYVCTERPAPRQDTKVDTFTRADQDGWGTASDGEAWVYRGTPTIPAIATISANQGLSAVDASGNLDRLDLGAELASANAELLVRWSVSVSVAANDGAYLELSAGHVAAQVTLDGAYYLLVGGSTNSAPTWAGGAAASLFWTRLRQDRGEVRIRTWADGAGEPTAWDAVWDSGIASPTAGKLSLWNPQNNNVTTTTFDSLTVSMLRPELPAPSVDAGHWDLLV